MYSSNTWKLIQIKKVLQQASETLLFQVFQKINKDNFVDKKRSNNNKKFVNISTEKG